MQVPLVASSVYSSCWRGTRQLLGPRLFCQGTRAGKLIIIFVLHLVAYELLICVANNGVLRAARIMYALFALLNVSLTSWFILCIHTDSFSLKEYENRSKELLVSMGQQLVLLIKVLSSTQLILICSILLPLILLKDLSPV